MTRPLLAYGPAAFWAAALLFLGGQSNLRVSALPIFSDKVAHFLLYAVLGGLAGWGWQRAGRWPAAIWPALFVLLVAACDEVRQRTVPGRSSEAADWIADALGSGLAFVWISRGIQRRNARKQGKEGSA